jgi:photosystem II stability/assembly factor-like uncharacterized protein
MKKIYTIIILISSIYLQAFSQTGWFSQSQAVNGQTLRSVYFTDKNTGWVVGDNGTILRTTNGGTDWTHQACGTVCNLYSVQFIDCNLGWALAGDSGAILKTTNGGNNWGRSFIAAGEKITSVCFADKNTGWVVSNSFYSIVYKTINGGTNWTPVNMNTGYISSVQFADNNTGWAVGSRFDYNWGVNYARILKTNNGGLSWTDQLGLYELPYVDLNSIHFIDNNTGWVIGPGNLILRTTNGGAYWGYCSSGDSRYISSIYFIEKKYGWISGFDGNSSGFIMKTTNGGNSWTKQTTATGYDILKIYFTDKINGWAVGYNGAILKTTTGGDDNFSNEPASYSLNQNYPNPFNPVTNVEFGIPFQGIVTLKVFDMLGKEIATLINSSLNPGQYEIQFNGSNYASGVYFYRLTAGEFTDTKRMMLVK